MSNEISNETKNTVLNMYEDGKSKAEIADKCGISLRSVGSIIDNARFIDMVFYDGKDDDSEDTNTIEITAISISSIINSNAKGKEWKGVRILKPPLR